MNKTIIITTILIAATVLSACSSPDEAIDEEVSHVSNEGPYGGHSLQWYELRWKAETTDQRNWCRQQKEAAELMQSCINADIAWKRGWANPKTNPPRSWEDGPKPN